MRRQRDKASAKRKSRTHRKCSVNASLFPFISLSPSQSINMSEVWALGWKASRGVVGNNASNNGCQLSGTESQLSSLLAVYPQACFSHILVFIGIYAAFTIINNTLHLLCVWKQYEIELIGISVC